jgi:hypothetical protein
MPSIVPKRDVALGPNTLWPSLEGQPAANARQAQLGDTCAGARQYQVAAHVAQLFNMRQIDAQRAFDAIPAQVLNAVVLTSHHDPIRASDEICSSFGMHVPHALIMFIRAVTQSSPF